MLPDDRVEALLKLDEVQLTTRVEASRDEGEPRSINKGQPWPTKQRAVPARMLIAVIVLQSLPTLINLKALNARGRQKRRRIGRSSGRREKA